MIESKSFFDPYHNLKYNVKNDQNNQCLTKKSSYCHLIVIFKFHNNYTQEATLIRFHQNHLMK